jgi:hypothetical protein
MAFTLRVFVQNSWKTIGESNVCHALLCRYHPPIQGSLGHVEQA